MSELDFRPKRATIRVPAGDSVSLTCTVKGIENLTNPVFTGQVISCDGVTVEDFTVDPTATGAVLRLLPSQTRALGDLAQPPWQRVVGQDCVVKTWVGRYDIQLTHDPDVVRTFVKGDFFVEEDVTQP